MINIFEEDDELKDEGLSDLERKAAAEDAVLDQTTNLQKDKIFNNNYESTDFGTEPIKFEVSSEYSGSNGTNLEDNIEGQVAFDEISKALDSSKFKEFNKPDKEGTYKKLNKLQINEVYSFVVMTLPNLAKIHVFSTIQDYFDVNSNKFYDSLSNTFKKQLIEELRELGNLHEKSTGPLF